MFSNMPYHGAINIFFERSCYFLEHHMHTQHSKPVSVSSAGTRAAPSVNISASIVEVGHPLTFIVLVAHYTEKVVFYPVLISKLGSGVICNRCNQSLLFLPRRRPSRGKL